METFCKTFTDGGNRRLTYISDEVNTFARNNNLEIVSISNIVSFTFDNGSIVSECIVTFRRKEEPKKTKKK